MNILILNGSPHPNGTTAQLRAACGDADSWALDALDAHYHALCNYLHLENVGELNALGMYTPANLPNSNYMEEAEKLGASLS